MEDRTIEAYRTHAVSAIKNWTRRRLRARRSREPLFIDEILSRMRRESTAGPRMIDLGCGPGLDAIKFARAGCEVLGVDLVPEFLKYANSLKKRWNMRGTIRFARCDIRRLRLGKPPLAAQPYDLIWANASLIHIAKRHLPGALARLARLVRADGVLAATFFHGRGEGVYEGSFVPGRFFSRYLKDELRKNIEASGWRVDTIRTVVNVERRGRWIRAVAVRSGNG